MLLNVQELRAAKARLTLQETIDVADLLSQVPGVRPAGPLKADVKAEPSGEFVHVDGQLDCNLEWTCVRCLTKFEEPLHIPYNESFKQVSQEVADLGEQDDEDFVPFHGDRLELRPYLQDELLLNLPLSPTCSEDCKGLDPETGEDLNGKPERPQPIKIDPRLEALKGWFDSERS
ncbi:YceD family protein [Cohnella sp. GCM10020058]|uniref:YceD family protein n=1 Tax=Cohnella sp. GCM10020058 TaxID=3317330 RepID=UPI003631D0C1